MLQKSRKYSSLSPHWCVLRKTSPNVPNLEWTNPGFCFGMVRNWYSFPYEFFLGREFKKKTVTLWQWAVLALFGCFGGKGIAESLIIERKIWLHRGT